MRPVIVDFLGAHGLPGWLAPGYLTMVVLAGIFGVVAFVELAKRDLAHRPASERRRVLRAEGNALAAGYVAALVGGHLVEIIRQLPQIIARGDLEGVLHTGRAAYGALIFGLLVPVLVLRRAGVPLRPFFDRLTVLLGITFALVRTGCFLGGCDYGLPTSGPLGVRFPADSAAALDHVHRGFTRVGAPSLPVHPTQLYEAAVGVGATLVALAVLRGGRRDGRAISAWLACYAVGRFTLETLRGDAARGIYAGLSSAQIISLAILAGLALAWWPRRRLVVASFAVVWLSAAPSRAQPAPAPESPAPAPAQAAPPPHPYPYPYPYPQHPPYPYPYAPRPVTPYPPHVYGQGPSESPPVARPPLEDPEPPEEPVDDIQSIANREHLVGLRAGAGIGVPLGRFQLGPWGVTELQVLFRVPFGHRARFEVGAEVGGVFGDYADHVVVGLPLQLTFGLMAHLEIATALVFDYHHVRFADDELFEPANAYGGRLELGLQFPVHRHFAVGLSPWALSFLTSRDVDPIYSFDQRLWVATSF